MLTNVLINVLMKLFVVLVLCTKILTFFIKIKIIRLPFNFVLRVNVNKINIKNVVSSVMRVSASLFSFKKLEGRIRLFLKTPLLFQDINLVFLDSSSFLRVHKIRYMVMWN